jgi:hypothetical protein
MPELLAAWERFATDSIALPAQGQRNVIEIQKTGKIQRDAQHRKFAPRSSPGKVLGATRPTDQASGSFSQGTLGGLHGKNKSN